MKIVVIIISLLLTVSLYGGKKTTKTNPDDSKSEIIIEVDSSVDEEKEVKIEYGNGEEGDLTVDSDSNSKEIVIEVDGNKSEKSEKLIELKWNEGEKGFLKAVKDASAKNTLMGIFFYSTKSELSNSFEEDYLSNNTIASLLTNYPLVKITQNKKLEEKYKVEGYPAFVLILPNEKAIRVLSPYMEDRTMDVSEFFEDVKNNISEIHIKKGKFYFKNKKEKESTDCFNIANEFANDVYTFNEVGNYFFKQGVNKQSVELLKKASENYQKGLELDEDNEALKDNLNTSLSYIEELKREQKNTNETNIKFKEYEPVSTDNLFFFDDKAGNDKNPKVIKFNRVANNYITTGEYKEAYENIKKAIEISPENDYLYYVAGYCFFEQGKLKKSKKLIEKSKEFHEKAISLNDTNEKSKEQLKIVVDFLKEFK